VNADFQHLLALRDARCAGCSSPEIDAIVITELKDRMLTALRTAIDQLEKIDCSQKPSLAARVNAELEWIHAVIAAFAGPDA
jgi:hypothetical protein